VQTKKPLDPTGESKGFLQEAAAEWADAEPIG